MKKKGIKSFLLKTSLVTILTTLCATLFHTTQANSEIHDKQKWIELYLRPCSEVSANQVCKERLEKDLGKLISQRHMILYFLDKYGLPEWLATIPIIESRYEHSVESHAGAIGLWQLMPHLIKHYETTRTIESGYVVIRYPTRETIERIGIDPVKNTEIACKHLAELHKVYKKDNLIVMAYNAGEKRVNDWLNGVGEPLADETINYYSQLMALQDIIVDVSTVNKYGLKPHKTKERYLYYKTLSKLKKSILNQF